MKYVISAMLGLIFSSSVLALSVEEQILAEYKAEQAAIAAQIAAKQAVTNPVAPKPVACPAVVATVLLKAGGGYEYLYARVYGGNTYVLKLSKNYWKVARKGYNWYGRAVTYAPKSSTTTCELDRIIINRLTVPTAWKVLVNP